MAFSLIPKKMCRSIYDIDPDELKSKGIRVLFSDLDNTLARYSQSVADEKVQKWRRAMVESGIEVFVLSNSRKSVRADIFCESMDIRYIKHAGKPKKIGFQRAFGILNVRPEETAIVGDQIFTDILGGNRSNVFSILVHPIAIDTIFRAIRYLIETPMRMMCRDKEKW